MRDENALIIDGPVHPWRGTGIVDAPVIADRDRVREALTTAVRLRAALLHAETPPDIRAAGTAWLAGDERDPLGAAVLALGLPDNRALDEEITGWITGHGPVFAARACAALAGLRLHHRGGPVIEHGEAGDEQGTPWLDRRTLAVLSGTRSLLASAGDEDYAAAVAALADARATGLRARITASFLAPTQTEWVTADVAAAAALGRAESSVPLLGASVDSLEQLNAVDQASHWPGRDLLFGRIMLRTITRNLGDRALPFLTKAQGLDFSGVDRPATLALIGAIPSEQALWWLIERLDQHRHVPPVVVTAVHRFPRRALWLLAQATPSDRVDDLLARQVRLHPGLVEDLLPRMQPEWAARVRAFAAQTRELPVATVLPPILANPPWTVRRKRPKPRTVPGLECTDPPAVIWEPGERDRLLRAIPEGKPIEDPAALADRVRRGELSRHHDTWGFLLTAPVEITEPLLSVWRPERIWGVEVHAPRLAARFGTAAYPLLLDLARSHPAEAGAQLLRWTGPEVALLMADWLTRLKDARRTALTWLRRHPEPAARALVPAAVGSAATPRRQATAALIALVAHGHRDTIVTVAEGYAVRDVIEAALDADPLDDHPSRLPTLPEWADPAGLPPIALRDGHRLPVPAVRHVLTMLMFGRPGAPYAGLARFAETADPASLAAFGRSLLAAWLHVGAPPKEGWALDAQAVLGDDVTAHRLATLIGEWPYEGMHTRAANGVDTLSRMGTRTALRLLHRISTTMSARAVRTRATDRLADIAEELGLTRDELADLLVPTLGLSADATMTLSFGARTFTAGFDQALRPWVADATGRRLSTLPPEARGDDPELAAAAHRTWTAAKRGVTKVAREQPKRLEAALSAGRTWSGAALRDTLIAHPLLFPIARRLLWATGDRTFRIAEDRTLADLDDEPFTLDDAAVVRPAHPAVIPAADLARWREVFAAYQIAQPFPQLDRPVLALTTEEAAVTRLSRLDGRTVPTGKLLGLERRGWQRETPGDGGHQAALHYDLPDGRRIIIELSPGIQAGEPKRFPEQTIEDIWIRPRGGADWGEPHETPFGTLDPVTASELLRDLTFS